MRVSAGGTRGRRCAGAAAGPGRAAGPWRCAACGQDTAGRPCTNPWCHRPDRGWSVVHSVGSHEGALRRSIVAYKYGGETGRAPTLAGLLARHLRRNPTWFEEFDLLTAVPAYLGPGARRGWDPVGRLVTELAAQLGPGWDVRLDVLHKTAETPAMSGRSRWERQRIAEGGLRQALTPGAVDVAGARILVVDDVCTEGCTLREVARALRSAGAEEVAGLVLSRPPLGWRPVPPGVPLDRPG